MKSYLFARKYRAAERGTIPETYDFSYLLILGKKWNTGPYASAPTLLPGKFASTWWSWVNVGLARQLSHVSSQFMVLSFGGILVSIDCLIFCAGTFVQSIANLERFRITPLEQGIDSLESYFFLKDTELQMCCPQKCLQALLPVKQLGLKKSGVLLRIS